MPQTVQLLRTTTNNAPVQLLPGAMSVELGGHTKLWLGSPSGNRLLISDNPAELPIAGNNYLPLAGGQLQGGLTLAGDPTTNLMASTRQYVDARAWQANPNNVFTYGRRGVGWIGIPSFDRIGASSAWDPGSIDPTNSGLIGIWSVVNQAGAATGWPADNLDQTAMILHGYNSNGGWQNQLMMGGRERGLGAPIWYRATQDGGIFSPWRKLISDAGGAFGGGINFGSQAVATPADLTRHIALWGTNYGLSVTGGRQNYVAPQHVFTNGNTDVLTISPTLSGGGPGLLLSGTSASFRSYAIGAAGVLRWVFQANTQDNLAINGFNDAGGSLGPWVTIARLTGATNLNGRVNLVLGADAAAGFAFGSVVAPGGPADLSRHIALWGGTFGFSVTSARLNHNASPNHVFLSNGVDIVTINATGLSMSPTRTLTLSGPPTIDLHATSKKYVDDLVGTVESVTTLAGSYDAAADMVRPVPGVSVAGPLPAAGSANFGWYLIIETAGFGTGNAPREELFVGDWLISNSTDWVHLNLNLETVEAHNVAVSPIPDLAATNVQDALEELPTKSYVDAHDPAIGNYLPITGGQLLGNLSVPVLFAPAISATGQGIAYTGLQADYHQIGFTWDGGWFGMFVDNTQVGTVATTDLVYGTFLQLAGGSVGPLNAASLYSSSNIVAANGVVLSTFNGSEWYMSADFGNGDKYHVYRNGWFDVWRGGNGDREWWNFETQTMVLNGGNGDLTVTRGNIVARGAVFAFDAFFGPVPNDSIAIFVSGDNTRYVNFNVEWGWGWSPGLGGNLYWINPWDGRLGLIVGSNGQCFNGYGYWNASVPPLEESSIHDYTAGLREILQLRPRGYQASIDVQRAFDTGEVAPIRIGLLLDEVGPVLPETIVKRPPFPGESEDEDLRAYDDRPVLYAVVNALQEIDARLRAGGL